MSDLKVLLSNFTNYEYVNNSNSNSNNIASLWYIQIR